jgi:hypothetical protein
MGWLCDRTIAALVADLDREPEEGLGRGMPFPTSWDLYFAAFMSSTTSAGTRCSTAGTTARS